MAVTNRTISFGAQPFFPPGIDDSNAGPFFPPFMNDVVNPCSRDSYAQAWQFAQSPRRKEFAANCPPGYHANGNCYGPGDTASAWDLDVDTASSADPSSGARP